jgi:hypothetical protein
MGWQIVVGGRRYATAPLGYLLWPRKKDGGSGRRERRRMGAAELSGSYAPLWAKRASCKQARVSRITTTISVITGSKMQGSNVMITTLPRLRDSQKPDPAFGNPVLRNAEWIVGDHLGRRSGERDEPIVSPVCRAR